MAKTQLDIVDFNSADDDVLSDQPDDKLVIDNDVIQTTQPNQKNWFRYKAALESLIPCRPFSKSQQHPNDNAGFFSILTFSWLTLLIWKILKKSPTVDKLWKTSQYDEAVRNYKRFVRIWKKEVEQKGAKDASLHRVVWLFVRTRIIVSSFCFSVFGLALFLSSGIVIRKLLEYVSAPNGGLNFGIALIGWLLGAEITRACFLTLGFSLNYRTALRTRGAILLLVFKKVMRTYSSKDKMSVGELVTLCSNDGDRIFEGCRIGNAFIVGPFLFIIGTIYTCFLLGAVSLIGSLVFIVILVLQTVVVKLMNKLRMKAVLHSEERIKKLNEILASIKMVKMYSWEGYFSKLIQSIREKELKALRQAAILQSVNVSFAFLTPVFAAVLMISAYVLLKNPLTPELAFTAVALYNAMANALKFMPIAIKTLADANISLNRFKNFLSREGVPVYVTNKVGLAQNAIEVEDASFAWNSTEFLKNDHFPDPKCSESNFDDNKHAKAMLITPLPQDANNEVILNHVNVTVKKGDLVGVCGVVGAGKSSFVSSIMGQMEILGGSVAVTGSIAYCAQQAWLMNATIRENILFGSVYDKQKYQDVITSCQLLPDFEIFQSGDLTEVGERGINLSGGQKQRISLARALYSNKDIYLFDDPLSALDAHVSKSIFMEVILERLRSKGKTILLVTHQTQYLSYCDAVFQVKGGQMNKLDMTEVKTSHADISGPEDAHSSTDQVSPKLENGLSLILSGSVEKSQVTLCDPSCAVKKNNSKDELEMELEGKLLTTEESGQGVSLSTYRAFIKACGGYAITGVMCLFFMVNVGAQQFSNFWLSYWLNQRSDIDVWENETYLLEANLSRNFSTTTSSPESNNILLNRKLNFYLTIYGLSALIMFVVSFFRGFAFVSTTINASRVLHNSLFTTVLNGTMAFFDTTPTGRILNRFQKDTDEQDVLLPFLLEMFLFNIASFLFAIGLVAFVFPKFLIVIGVLFPIFLVIYVVFKPSARELRRLDALTRSPWFAHIATTITGMDSIRAYRRMKDFVSRFCDLLDKNGVPFYLFACLNRWLAVRLDVLTIISCVVLSILVIVNRNLVTPAYTGLALSSSFFMSGMLQFTIRMLVETEARFVCIDRIKYYISNTSQESSSIATSPKPNWPEFGKIEFRNVCMRYRDGLPLVLKDLSFTFCAGERIGVVGRTGSGKSSLSVALFRLTELASGSIWVDEIDISSISLHHLRSQLSIIPQDPVLFSGTIRSNLDPFDLCNDAEIWLALEQAHLKNAVSKLMGQLDEEVFENGSNFSVGERQLLCLARALLRKSKILILDEATAAIDLETEKIVQEIIDRMFSQCTIITIAHRLSTVINSDRIMVLDQGKIVELDEPQKLFNDKSSAFSTMLNSFKAHIPQQS